MWEARAAPGRGGELLVWVLDAVRTGAAGAAGDGPGGGAQVYRSRGQGGERVVVILYRPSGAAASPDSVLPAPPGDLLAGPPRAWDFLRVEVGS
jgi:hypothetical protein